MFTPINFDKIIIKGAIFLIKDNIKKIIKYIVILVLSLIYLITQIYSDILPDYDFLWTLFSILGALAIYFYNDSIFLFTLFNNLWNCIWRKPQVTWEMYYSFHTTQPDSFILASEKLLSCLNKNGSLKVLEETTDYIEYELEKPDIRKYSLNCTLIDDNTFALTSYYKCTLSYKESKKELDNATTFSEKLFSSIAKIDEKISEQNPLLEVPYHTLRLSFSKYNPVYGLMVKRLNQNKIENFKLSFEEGDSEIIIEKNCITIRSRSLTELKLISKNYLALTDIT